MQQAMYRRSTTAAWAAALFAAVAAVGFRVAARRPGSRWLPGTERQSVAVAAPGSPGLTGRSASAVEQMERVFHELHADGRNALCGVCDSRYGSAQR
jgi:hypothetical protein